MTRFLTLLILSVSLFATEAAAQRLRLIGDIQGEKNYTPYEREVLRTTGIVTARASNGFYLQTPDDRVDNNPNTSEGIFVFTRTEPTDEATVGNLVSVTGTVSEFVPRPDPFSLPVTQISMVQGRDFIAVESKGNPLPKPVVLTAEDFKPNAIDQLEKYEGMRVTVPELMVTAPTNGRVDEKTGNSESNGIFYGVLKGTPRPYREPGFDVTDFFGMADKDRDEIRKKFPKIASYDHNPERLRIESLGQLGGQAINVTTFAELKGLTGVVSYSFRAYSILVDPGYKPVVSGGIKAERLPSPADRQVTIAGMNIERLFDTNDDPKIEEPVISAEGLDRRLKKMSMAVRNYMNYPDVIGIAEAEDQAALKLLAERINKDAVTAGFPDPKYQAYVETGNDIGGIDSGFLVKTARVEVLETAQFGKDEKYRNPVTKEDNFLNDRPPFLLRAAIKDEKTGGKFEFTVVVNHLKSLRGYGFNEEKDYPAVRMKKRLQAEFLAKWLNERQKANPNERIALVGDFNAFQFSDGITDVIDTIKGTPTAKDAVINSSDDLVNPDLVNIVYLLPAAQRYSYVFDGNAQVLDHVIINEALRKHIAGFAYARINADFPETYRNQPNRVERFSDHDPAVAVFTLD